MPNINDQYGTQGKFNILVQIGEEQNVYRYHGTFEYKPNNTIEVYDGNRKLAAVYPISNVVRVEVER